MQKRQFELEKPHGYYWRKQALQYQYFLHQFLISGFSFYSSKLLIKAKEVSTAECTTEKSLANLQLSFKKLKFKSEHWLFPLQFPIISDVCTRFYIPAKLVLLRMTQIDPFTLINSMKFLAGNSQEHSG